MILKICKHCHIRTLDDTYDVADCKWCGGKEFQFKGQEMTSNVEHPSHYGGKDNPYEAIKVIEAWKLGFNLGNTVKYISRWDKKNTTMAGKIEDMKKALFYLNREIENMEKMQNGTSSSNS